MKVLKLTWAFLRPDISSRILMLPVEFGGIQNVCDGKGGFSLQGRIASSFMHPDSQFQVQQVNVSVRITTVLSLRLYTPQTDTCKINMLKDLSVFKPNL